MSYSSRISYVLDRLNGFSTNRFSLMPNGSRTSTANSIITFTLPSNAILNMRSFALTYDASITSANDHGRLPTAHQLIHRYDVKAGGNLIQAGANAYGTLVTAKNYLGCFNVCNVTEHAEVVASKSPYTDSGTDGITSSLEVANTQSITNWDGFLGTCSPPLIDSGMIGGDFTLQFYLAENAVCLDADGADLSVNLIGKDAAAPAPVYKLDNIRASIEVCAMADGTYENIVNAIIQQKGHLEIPFKNYVSFEDSVSNAMRFQVATQSLDRIWVVHRSDSYSTAGGGKLVTGYLAHTGANATTNDPVMGYNKQKVISKYFSFVEPSSTAKFQFQLNGSNIPNYQADIHEMAVITKNSLPEWAEKAEWSMLTYRNNYCVFCLRLNLPKAEEERIIAGLDTRGISLNGFYNMYNVSSNKNVALFAEMTSVFRVGLGGQSDCVI